LKDITKIYQNYIYFVGILEV